MPRDRSEDIHDLVETVMQECIDNIAARIAPDWKIRKLEADAIKRALGPVTFTNFVKYVESQGYSVQE